jgi:hypothetical protein
MLPTPYSYLLSLIDPNTPTNIDASVPATALSPYHSAALYTSILWNLLVADVSTLKLCPARSDVDAVPTAMAAAAEGAWPAATWRTKLSISLDTMMRKSLSLDCKADLSCSSPCNVPSPSSAGGTGSVLNTAAGRGGWLD